MKKQDIKNRISIELSDYVLPRFVEIPNVGLYLKQVVKYIDEIVCPLGITVSDTMLSNYVKMHMVDSPEKKMYYRNQIATLICIVLMKSVLPLESIQLLIGIQKAEYETEVAYDYFCGELENVFGHVDGKLESMVTDAEGNSEAKNLLRNVIITLAFRLNVEKALEALAASQESEEVSEA